jgi:phenylacetate-CoA ligase
MALANSIYQALPVWGQHAAVTSFGLYWHWLRFGPGFRASARDYERRENYNAADWTRFQQERLAGILGVAADHVPYYRQTWTNAEKTAAREGRLTALPLLSKEPLRADPWSFTREDMRPLKAHVFHTSGSTGTPIASIWTTREVRDSLALREVRSARWAGVSFQMARATFSGRMVVPDPESTGPFHRYNAVEHQVYLSAFHLRPDTVAAYVGALARHRVQWLTGYAVSYYVLAKFILEQRLSPPPIRAIVTTSEKVTPEMRQVMEAGFRCKVFEEYSTVENVVFASECPHGKLHVSPDACVLEILRPDSSPCAAGDVGEVVATCLMRDYQPLVRFRLGDLAAWDLKPCSCGSSMPVLAEVVGRVEDVVVGPDGRQMVRFHGIFVGQPRVVEGQIVQERLDRIRVKVVGTCGFGAADEADIIARVRQRLGPRVQVVVEKVDAIPRTKNGKFKAVVSMLALAERAEAGVCPGSARRAPENVAAG